jgi:hypothetical protein
MLGEGEGEKVESGTGGCGGGGYERGERRVVGIESVKVNERLEENRYMEGKK